MNENTSKKIARMKEQTFGVEIEMNSITREWASQLAAAFFGTGRFENTARRNGYMTWSAWDAEGRERTIHAFAYIMHENRPHGVPSHWYVDTCMKGYDAFYFDRNILTKAVDDAWKYMMEDLK